MAYNVTLTGAYRPGTTPTAVHTQLAQLFKQDPARIEQLIRQRSTIKRGVDYPPPSDIMTRLSVPVLCARLKMKVKRFPLTTRQTRLQRRHVQALRQKMRWCCASCSPR